MAKGSAQCTISGNDGVQNYTRRDVNWCASLVMTSRIAEAAVIANFAAGVEVGKLGPVTVSSQEVLGAYDQFIFSRQMGG